MTVFFAEDTQFIASGPDLHMGMVQEPQLPDLLREHGPERLFLYAQLIDGTVEQLEVVAHRMTGKDDLAKYYVTAYASPTTGRMIEIGWDV